ncbi:MAG: hypothetical protein HQL31_03780 [Planctomycetes bacterium]|nr:hypothetical protein [Planctomycetota bacterium]
MEGGAGGDALSRDLNLADTYPMALFRYLAGTHTGLVTRLSSNSAKLCSPGMSRGADRMVLGRALMHDIGVDASALGHKADALQLVKALHEFGYFEKDGKTEFLPYWRIDEIVRLGPAFNSSDAFSLKAENPLSRVYISAYIRPSPGSKTLLQAVLVVVNESDSPVREQLNILNPARLFGGPNRNSAVDSLKVMPMTGVPEDSDWKREQLIYLARGNDSLHTGEKNPPAYALRDLEDGGWVVQSVNKGGFENYGLLYIPARSYRILYGSGETAN